MMMVSVLNLATEDKNTKPNVVNQIILVTHQFYPVSRPYDSLVQKVLGDSTKVEYIEGLPFCVDRIKQNEVLGIIIPEGHGDSNTIHNLEVGLGTKLELPILREYALNGWRSTAPYSSSYSREIKSRYGENYIENWLEHEVKPLLTRKQ